MGTIDARGVRLMPAHHAGHVAECGNTWYSQRNSNGHYELFAETAAGVSISTALARVAGRGRLLVRSSMSAPHQQLAEDARWLTSAGHQQELARTVIGAGWLQGEPPGLPEDELRIGDLLPLIRVYDPDWLEERSDEERAACMADRTPNLPHELRHDFDAGDVDITIKKLTQRGLTTENSERLCRLIHSAQFYLILKLRTDDDGELEVDIKEAVAFGWWSGGVTAMLSVYARLTYSGVELSLTNHAIDNEWEPSDRKAPLALRLSLASQMLYGSDVCYGWYSSVGNVAALGVNIVGGGACPSQTLTWHKVAAVHASDSNYGVGGSPEGHLADIITVAATVDAQLYTTPVFKPGKLTLARGIGQPRPDWARAKKFAPRSQQLPQKDAPVTLSTYLDLIAPNVNITRTY